MNKKVSLQTSRDVALRALKIRLVEDLLLKGFEKGDIYGTVHTSIGQELIAPCLADQLLPGDFIFGTHRSHHHFLENGGTASSLFCELLGREGGASLGLGGTQHLKTEKFMSNGIQGGMTPLALGFASTAKERERLAVAVIGDGTLATGIVYETLNWALLWDLPVLFLVEDNEIAQSTPQRDFLSSSAADRFKGFGCHVFETSSLDLQDLYDDAASAVSFVRGSSSPALLWVKTQRLKSHSKGDDNRPSRVVKNMESVDLLNRLLADNFEIKDAETEMSMQLDEIYTETLP